MFSKGRFPSMTVHFIPNEPTCACSAFQSARFGPNLADWKALQAQVGSFGMKWTVIEGNLPFENMKRGRDDGSELAEFKSLLGRAGGLGVTLVCYNWVAGSHR